MKQELSIVTSSNLHLALVILQWHRSEYFLVDSSGIYLQAMQLIFSTTATLITYFDGYCPLKERLKRLLTPKPHPNQSEHHPEQVGRHGHGLERQKLRHYRAILL